MKSGLQGHWFSRQGSSRKQNGDVCAVFSSGSYVIALVGDASERGLRGAEYVAQWMQHIICAAAERKKLSCECILELMRQAQASMRFSFPSERACYVALFIDHHKNGTWVMSCGDCRVGLQRKGVELAWVTPVHSMANWCGEEFTPEHASLESRHTVTRTLNSRRFRKPDIVEMEYDISASWILATDGYWIEHQIQKTPIVDLEDDASFLRISFDTDTWVSDTDCGNCHLILRTD